MLRSGVGEQAALMGHPAAVNVASLADPLRELGIRCCPVRPPALHRRTAPGVQCEVEALGVHGVHDSLIPRCRPRSRVIAPFASSSTSW